MPRRYYYARRYYGGSRRKARKWSPSLVRANLALTAAAGVNSFTTLDLCGNSSNVGANVPVSTIIKAKNFKTVIDVTSGTGGDALRNFFLAIMYIPQGFVVTGETPAQHPEWILVWRSVDVSFNGQQLQNVQISSRLARNLNSGDKIVMFVSVENTGVSTANVNLGFFCSFVTCNN